jgi:hypothetical protein
MKNTIGSIEIRKKDRKMNIICFIGFFKIIFYKILCLGL